MELRTALDQVLGQNPEEPNLKKYMRYYPTGLYPFPDAHPLYTDYLQRIDVPEAYQALGQWSQVVSPSLLFRLVVASLTARYSLSRRTDGTLSLALELGSALEQGQVPVDSLSAEQVTGLVQLYLKEQILLEASTLKQEGDDAPVRPDMNLQSELRKLRTARLVAYRDYLVRLG